MKKWYNQLSSLNGDLLREYKIRNQNHQDLMDTLKLINQGIQKASKLRGKIALCYYKYCFTDYNIDQTNKRTRTTTI